MLILVGVEEPLDRGRAGIKGATLGRFAKRRWGVEMATFVQGRRRTSPKTNNWKPTGRVTVAKARVGDTAIWVCAKVGRESASRRGVYGVVIGRGGEERAWNVSSKFWLVADQRVSSQN